MDFWYNCRKNKREWNGVQGCLKVSPVLPQAARDNKPEEQAAAF